MKAIITTTSLRDGLLWHQDELAGGAADCVHQVTVYPYARYQTFEGFGGAFTEASAHAWRQLPPDRRQAFLDLCFGEGGLRYTQGRVHMGSCDFSLGNYACQAGPEDKGFHTEHDDQYLIPMIQAAQAVAGRPIELLLSPWSPPGFMKTNGEMNHGGSLKPEYRARWAECMAGYAAHYRSMGCDVRRMSIQNEPAAVQTWDSCIWSGAEEGAFAAEYLSPALKKAGCGDVKILAWDHNKDILVQRVRETLSAKGAAEAVGGFAVHWYTGDHFEALRIAKELWPDKELWFSEGCVEYSRFDGMTPLQKAEMYAHDILGNLNGGISGSIDWNLLLDARGGPNHVGNFCEAPVMLTEDNANFTVQNEYYYIGQFSRFIRPGAVRLGSSAWTDRVEVTAFENRDGDRTAVVLNRTEKEAAVSVTEDAQEAWNFVIAPHSIATLRWR
ncbi:MAG: glucosylceramidase [Oscillibacter sp.]|nr:glucosylceramidase [Oscillibacter sp.]